MAKKTETKGKTIKGKAKGEAVGLRFRKHKRGETAELDLLITRTEKQCVSLFGEDFAQLAFGQMCEIDVGDGKETIHLAKSVTAADRFRLGRHIVRIDGYQMVVTPKLQKVYPVEKSDKVTVAVRMPVSVGDDDLGTKLVEFWKADSIEIDFSPKQEELPLTGGAE
jgi:hypothetical protein